MTPTELTAAIGDVIRARRVAAGLSQRELGARAGIVGKYVSEIERGTRDLPLSTLVAVVEHGLRLHLHISIQSKESVPVNVAELATSVSQLPANLRTRVVAVVRTIIDLVS